MTEEKLNELQAKIPELQRAIREFNTFKGDLEGIESEIRAVDSEAASIGEEFANNYMGSRVDVRTSVGSIKAGTLQALRATSSLIAETTDYVNKLLKLLQEYTKMVNNELSGG